jgi:hypothetical protein
MEWNAGYLEGCEAQARDLGVKLNWGASEAQSGFCVLWVQPALEAFLGGGAIGELICCAFKEWNSLLPFVLCPLPSALCPLPSA